MVGEWSITISAGLRRNHIAATGGHANLDRSFSKVRETIFAVIGCGAPSRGLDVNLLTIMEAETAELIQIAGAPTEHTKDWVYKQVRLILEST